MKRAIFFIATTIIISSFSSQLFALPKGAIARLGIGTVNAVTYSPDSKYLAVASSIGVFLLDPINLAEIHFFDTNARMTSVAFSPNSSIIVSGSNDKTIKIWDAKSKTLVTTLEGHSEVVTSVAFNPDGSLLASGSIDKTIKIWDVKKMTLTATLKKHSDRITSVTFSPDGSLLASGSDDETIKLWDVNGWKLITTLEAESGANCITFSPNGSLIAIGTYYGIKLWDIKSQKLIATLYGYEKLEDESSDWSVESVAFSPNGSLLAAGSEYVGPEGNKGSDSAIKIWNVKSRKLVKTLEWGRRWLGWSGSVTFSPDGSLLASNDEGYINLWNVKSWKLVNTLGYEVDFVTFSPDGSLLASNGGGDINLWDVNSWKLITTLKPRSKYITFNPDGSLLASSTYGGIELWEVKNKKLITNLGGDSDNSIAFSPDGSMLASMNDDSTIHLWDIKSRALVFTIEPLGRPLLTNSRTYNANLVAFSPDGNLLASCGGDDKGINLWDVESRNLITTLVGSWWTSSVAFSPDSSLLASGGDVLGDDKTVRLWDVRSRTLVATLENSDRVRSVAFSPDGSLLASGGKDIKLWDVKSRTLVATIEGFIDGVYSIVFSPDGSMLASGSDCTIILLDMKPYIQKSVDNVSKLKEIINVRLSQQPIYPPYLLDTDSFLSATNTIWQNFTDWFRRNDLTDNYEELYFTGIEYDSMKYTALIRARDFLEKSDIANAKNFLNKADTYEKMSNMSFQGASYVFEANLEAAKAIAQSIKDGCQASVKFGLKFVNPTAAETADWVYDVVDLSIEYYIGDKDQAVKDFILKRSVSIMFDKLGDQTISDWSKNRAGKYLFPQLSKFIKSEEWQWALSKVIKEGVSSISEETLTKIVKFTVNEADKTMNYVDAKP